MRVTLGVALLACCFARDAAAVNPEFAVVELKATHNVYAIGLDGPERVRAPGRRGVLRVVRASPQRSDAAGDVLRYAVEVEGGLRVDPAAVARTVERVLRDDRGWERSGRRFARVSRGATDFRVVVASPALTDALCAEVGLATMGRYSCAAGSAAVLNVRRWLGGARADRGALNAYRTDLVNHEVGHVLGHGHAYCPAAGSPAPVMLQQTKGVGACRANPWPLPSERW